MEVENDIYGLEKTVKFLKKYAWIYNFAVVDLLVEGALDTMDPAWKETLENVSSHDLNLMATGKIEVHWPHVLKDFLQDCTSLKFSDNKRGDAVSSSMLNNMKGVSCKKTMEISILSKLIDQECKEIGIHHIVDLGCGLGHLDQLLSEKFGYKVLGLEAQGSVVKTAKLKHQSKNADFFQLQVQEGEQGTAEVKKVVSRWLRDNDGEKACLIGLHTCGNLASSTLLLFESCTFFSSLVLAPCCFHKLVQKDSSEGEETFSSFPLSSGLKGFDEKYEGRKFLRRPFLRLASQMSAKKWSKMSELEHQQHSMHVLSRAALQLYAKENKLLFSKSKRKALNKSALGGDRLQLIQNLVSRYKLIDEEGRSVESVDAETGIERIFNKYWSDLHLIEGLTALQCCLQEPSDRLLFSDMQQFLTEHHLHLNRVESLWDETLSPRSHAILATRNHTS